MKMKSDFVTNSSSCSFVAWGITMYVSDIKAKCGPRLFSLMKKAEAKAEDSAARNRGAFMAIATAPDEEKLKAEYKEFIEGDTEPYEIEEILQTVGLETDRLPEEDEIMIGISPFSIGEDQTLSQFKESICNKFKLAGLEIKPEELCRIEEAWKNS